MAQIYRDDLNDRDEALATFQDFLKHYPNSKLAPKARQAVVELGTAEVGGDPFRPKSRKRKHAPHTERSEQEAKVAWADVHPVKPAAATRTERTEARTMKSTRDNVPEPKGSHEDSPAADEKSASPSEQADAQEQQVSATPSRPAQSPGNRMPRLTSIRHWSTPDYVRVAIDLEQEVKYQAGRVPHPDRIFFDLYGVKLAPDLVGKTFDVEAGFLHRIRVSQFKANMARVVLDVDDVAEYSAFLLPNPYRLIIDIHGKLPAQLASKHVPDVVADTKPAAEKSEKKASAQAELRDADATPDQSDVTVRKIK